MVLRAGRFKLILSLIDVLVSIAMVITDGAIRKTVCGSPSPCRRQHRRTAMKKCTNTYKAYLNYESEFSHHCACWAANHNGWAKMKKANKRIAKRRLKQDIDKMMRREEYELL